MRPSRFRPPPTWALVLTLALVAALQLWRLAHGRAPLRIGSADGAQAAWLAWVGLIAGWIKTGSEVIGKLTLLALRWAVANLSLVAARLGNGLKSLGHALLVGVKDTWAFFRSTYEDVLKPAMQKLWGWFKTFRQWLKDTFGPILKHLTDLRDTLLRFWKTYVRPWLDLIDVTRRLLNIFGAMGLDWAKKLDRKLAEFERLIEQPFKLLLGKINEVIGIVNRIITVDGLIQRVALIGSLGRDYQQAWRAITQPYSAPVASVDRDKMNAALAAAMIAAGVPASIAIGLIAAGVVPLPPPTVQQSVSAYIRTGSGAHRVLLDEMTIIWRKAIVGR
jgi:hypothetical protein